jgi:hypothetical protein
VEPDQAVVVGVRIVTPFAYGHQRDSPAAGDTSLISRSATERALPAGTTPLRGVLDAGGERIDPAPGSVEGDGVVSSILHPEVPAEAFSESIFLRPQFSAQAGVSPHLLGNLGGTQERVVNGILDLAGAKTYYLIKRSIESTLWLLNDQSRRSFFGGGS